jgi:hypothetical protein
MKKCIGLTVAAGLILFGLANNSFAQDTSKVVNLTPVVVTGAASSSFSAKALTAFTKAYPNAMDVKWYKVEENFLVTFTLDDHQNRAVYDKKGSQVYALMYGTEKDLAKSLRKLIYVDYEDYDITAAVHITQGDDNMWVVTLHSKKDFLTLAVEGDQITLRETVKKEL